MWMYIVLASMWGGIVAGWLVPVIRRRITGEIYEACGLGSCFTILILGLGGVGIQLNILPLRIIGFVLLAPAALFTISSFAALKRRGKPETGWEHTTVMVKSNIFRIVRHPMYLGTAIWAIGAALIFQSIPSTILGIVSAFCCWMASKKEDSFNIEKFGDSYKEYVERVPMWNAFRGLRKIGNLSPWPPSLKK
jgi:protein-S-isoprenylcysteine O-methyltransferase Ste14